MREYKPRLMLSRSLLGVKWNAVEEAISQSLQFAVELADLLRSFVVLSRRSREFMSFPDDSCPQVFEPIP